MPPIVEPMGDVLMDIASSSAAENSGVTAEEKATRRIWKSNKGAILQTSQLPETCFWTKVVDR